MSAKSTIRFSLMGLVVAAALASGAAMAQAAPQANDPGHPRVNEVNQRLDNQQNRIQKGVADELGPLKDTQGKPEVGPYAPKK